MNRYRILRISYICILQLYLLMAHLINSYGVKKQNGAAHTCKKENKKYQYQKSISLFQFKFQLEKSFVFLFFFFFYIYRYTFIHVKNILLHYIKRRKKDRLDITKLIVYFPHLIHYLYYVIHFNLIIH